MTGHRDDRRLRRRELLAATPGVLGMFGCKSRERPTSRPDNASPNDASVGSSAAPTEADCLDAVDAHGSTWTEDAYDTRYRELLRVALTGPYLRRTCQMLCAPSFGPESAVFISCEAGALTVVARFAPVNLWQAYMWDDNDLIDRRGYRSRKMKLPNVDALRPRLAKGVEEESAPIDTSTFELLEDVWTTLLLAARPSSFGGGADGTDYLFATLRLAAKKHSPDPNSVPGRLVHIAEGLATYASSRGGQRQRAELVAAAQALLREHGREVTPWRLDCRPLPDDLPGDGGLSR